MDNTIKIAWLFPDTLYLHGERGNLLAFSEIAKKMGLNADIKKIGLEDDFVPSDFDIIYASAGELNRLDSVREKLMPLRDQLIEFIQNDRPLIVTGNTVQFFGEQVFKKDHTIDHGVDLINIDSTENPSVYGDDILIQAIYNGQAMKLFGNQIQMADLDIKDEKPFGEILYGYGNNGKTVFEGVQKNNSIFTNMLGPLLVLNPWLTEEILKVAANNKGIYPNYPELVFELEKKSLDSKTDYTMNKKTNLTNLETN